MVKRIIGVLAAMAVGAAVAMAIPMAGASPKAPLNYEPVLDPSNFGSVIDNEYFPLPVGRKLVYEGTKDGVTQRDVVTVTDQKKVVEGITATVVSDIAKHGSTLLEKTFDWYAQDNQGNVWYLGEDTKSYESDGTIDTSGSWTAGVNDGEPGIIMEAYPHVPDAYRQEYLAGQAEDTAWVANVGGSVTVPYGTFHNTLSSLEATQVEPGSYDLKVYGPGVGIVLERALTGESEVARLVRVTG